MDIHTLHDSQGRPFAIPGLSPEQNENTIRFLEQVVACPGDGSRCLILRQRILSRNTYQMYRDEHDGKLHFVYNENSERILTGRAGVDWTKPAVYNLVKDSHLTNTHIYHYPCRVQKKSSPDAPETQDNTQTDAFEWVRELRPPVLESIMDSDIATKYLFVPVLVTTRSLMQACVTRMGIPYTAMRSYCTSDVCWGRCLWVDIDGHSLPIEEIMERNPQAISLLMELLPEYCAATGIPMPAVVDSGRGVHLYWWLDQAVDIRTPLEQLRFKRALDKLSDWAADLIQSDPLCTQVWETDHSTAAIYHLMNLPGCVHPKTGKRRYVVNRLGRDYQLCSYDALCKALELPAEVPELPAEVPEEPMEQQNTLPQIEIIQPLCRSYTPYNARVRKLLRWAEGRGWDLYPGRRLFLLYLGICMQCGAGFDLTLPDNYPLQEINQRMHDPLPAREVEQVLQSLIRKATSGQPYHITDAAIAAKLHMTDAECQLFCAPGSEGANRTGREFFLDQHAYFMATTPKEDGESPAQHRQRCYQLTKAWFASHRDSKTRHAARTRQRMAREGYKKEGGRPSKYTDADRQHCLALQKSGMSVRQIASELGISKSAVARMTQPAVPKPGDY